MIGGSIMESSTAERGITTWLLSAALAFNMLWPAFAQAKPAGEGIALVICTATGFHTLGATGDGKAAPLHLPGKLHCPLCLNPCDQAILPASIAPPAWHTLLPTTLVHPQPAEPRFLTAHALAQPRAPPFLFFQQLD